MKNCFVLFSLLFCLSGCDDEHAKIIDPAQTLLKSYESVGGNARLSVFYEYDSANRLSKINWERATPHITVGSDELKYDNEGRLIEKHTSISGLVREMTTYRWDEELIIASATYDEGKKRAFQFFEYNAQGLLESMENYIGQEGGFLRADSTGFHYHADGDLYKIIKYAYDTEEQRMVFLSATVFDEYIVGHSPVSAIEILPAMVLHKKLPSKYTDERPEGAISYTMEYQLRSDGYPSERVVKSLFGEERTTFTYNR